jgi:hypothetical protein
MKRVNPVKMYNSTNSAMKPKESIKYCTSNCTHGTVHGCYITCGMDGKQRRVMSKCDAVMRNCNKCIKANPCNSKEVRCGITGRLRGREDGCDVRFSEVLESERTRLKDANGKLINVGDVVELEGVE